MGLKNILFKIAVKMLANTFMTFALVFLLVSVPILALQAAQRLTTSGAFDIDPFPALFVSFLIASAVAGLTNHMMRKYSHVGTPGTGSKPEQG